MTWSSEVRRSTFRFYSTAYIVLFDAILAALFVIYPMLYFCMMFLHALQCQLSARLPFFSVFKSLFARVTNRRKRRRRVLKPCRKIGKRRFCRKRRKHFRSFPYASFVLKCCISFFPFVLFFGGMAWAMSPKQRNKIQHSINGNGKGGKTGKGRNAPSSKGKGKASPQPVVVAAPVEDLTEDDIVTQIRQALPSAALLRSQSELVQSEWSVPCRTHQELDSSGGVSLVPRSEIPAVLRRVGWTGNATAMVISQDPDSLSMRGYPRTRVYCQISVMGDGGIRTEARVHRFLVQLGSGDSVQMLMQGALVSMYTTMVSMVAKFSLRHHWPPGPIPASVVIDEISSHVSSSAVDDILSRQDQSVSFLLHGDFVEQLLRASGPKGVFYKIRKDTKHPLAELELLWLDENVDFDTAVELSKHQLVLGMVEKGSSLFPRFALRFTSLDHIDKFCKEKKLDNNARLGSWKVTGVHASIGQHGALAFLVAQQWQDVEVLYLKEDQMVFLSANCGNCAPMWYVHEGTKRQIKFKATNTAAKNLAKSNSMSSRVQVAPVLQSQKERKKSFLDQVFPAEARAKAASPSQPSMVVDSKDKRISQHQTGSTPDKKKVKPDDKPDLNDAHL